MLVDRFILTLCFGKVSQLYDDNDEYSFFLTDCRTVIGMGMPHLSPLERERLACLLARNRFVREMPHRSDLKA